jgi:predicted nucleic acid-binding protein
MKEKVYLDVCALCRPFDDQSYLRVRLETEAVNLIFSKIRTGMFGLMVSPVHFREIADIAELKERVELESILKSFGRLIEVDLRITKKRTRDLMLLGFGVADAAHVAFAEQAGASFITCDDKLAKRCLKCDINIWTGSPIAFCEKENLK